MLVAYSHHFAFEQRTVLSAAMMLSGLGLYIYGLDRIAQKIKRLRVLEEKKDTEGDT